MSKSSKKKGAKKGMASSTMPEREPFSPYVSNEGVHYSGLETEGMKTFNCSLLLPPERVVTPSIVQLKPKIVTLYRDRHFHSENERVSFPGATVLHLEVSTTSSSKQMPEPLTVAGRCRFTKACWKDYSIMMRTNAEARRKGIPVNGAFDWPDVRCLQLCPVCQHMAEPDDGQEYWMLFYPLLQLSPPANIGTRTIYRLTCAPCMESLVSKFGMRSEAGGIKPMMEVLKEDLPPVTFLDAATNPIIEGLASSFTAWSLYTAWDYSGAWEANESIRKRQLEETLGGGSKWEPSEEAICGQDMMVVDIGSSKESVASSNKSTTKEQDGTKEDDNKKKKPNDSQEQMPCCVCSELIPFDNVKRCSRCKVAIYCSRACQKNDWKTHKVGCVPLES